MSSLGLEVVDNTTNISEQQIEALACKLLPRIMGGLANNQGLCYRDGVNLDNCITQQDLMPLSEGDFEMAKSIRQSVVINGKQHWISAKSLQEFTNKVAGLLANDKTQQNSSEKHAFSDYAWNWYRVYAEPNIATVTATTYKRQLTLYLVPHFAEKYIEDITTDDIQELFNGMERSKATKEKIKIVLNQILEAAVDEEIIHKNPLKSRRLKIKGAASKETEPYTVEQMRYLVQHIGDVSKPTDRTFLALQAFHPMRLEEVLGLKGEDIDVVNKEIHICRAATHPTRNLAEIKDTKTASSHRVIGLSDLALPYLLDVPKGKFILGGDKPLSYTQVRRICDRIKADTKFSENITPIRFRTTVLTDLYDQTKDIKLTQTAAGHTTSAMTLKHYIKGRESISHATQAVDQAYM